MYQIRAYVDVDWVAPGVWPGQMGMGQANEPPMNAGLYAGPGQIAQTLRIQQGEQILTNTSLSALTQDQFNTAIDNLAADLKTAFAATNSTGQTNLAQAQGWATGQP